MRLLRDQQWALGLGSQSESRGRFPEPFPDPFLEPFLTLSTATNDAPPRTFVSSPQRHRCRRRCDIQVGLTGLRCRTYHRSTSHSQVTPISPVDSSRASSSHFRWRSPIPTRVHARAGGQAPCRGRGTGLSVTPAGSAVRGSAGGQHVGPARTSVASGHSRGHCIVETGARCDGLNAHHNRAWRHHVNGMVGVDEGRGDPSSPR